MTGTQERAVAAMRAIGDTVTGAPPLRLPAQTAAAAESPQPAPPRQQARLHRLGRPAMPSGPAGHGWRLWLVPAAAAVAVVAIAVSLAVMRSAPKESAVSPGTETSASASASAGGSLGVPPYYVTLPAFGWYAYAPATPRATAAALVVGETATGKRLAVVPPPHGMTFNVVSGAADDRTLVVGATSYSPTEKTVSTIWFETWYLLRISPGTAHVARLTRLPIPVLPSVTGAAISPDGSELAVAWQQFSGPSWSSASGRPGLAVMSLSTGKELLHWGTTQGRITAAAPAAGARPDPFDTAGLATALRWTTDGRELAYAWNGSQIRLLDLDRTTPTSYQGDLVKASTVRAAIGYRSTLDGPSFTCEAADGWSLSTGARTFTCAGSFTPATLAGAQTATAGGAACTRATPAHPALVQQIALSDGATGISALAQAPGCQPTGPRAKSASFGWSSPDGSTVIAMLGDLSARDDRFGVFTKKTFTALPALQANGSLVTVAW